jgi:hypothetical protein
VPAIVGENQKDKFDLSWDLPHEDPSSSRHGSGRYSGRYMGSRNTDWRKAYASARVELDPARLVGLCAQARRAMQHRLVELAATDGNSGAEQNELEEALRDLFVIEQGIQKPDLQ